MSRRRIFLTALSLALIGLGVFGFWQVKASAQARAYQTAYPVASQTAANGQTYGFGGYGMMGGYAAGYGSTYGAGYSSGYGAGYGSGYGMMGGYAAGYSTAYGPGYGMMGAYGYGSGTLPANVATITQDQAAKAVDKYLSGLGTTGKDLVVAGAPTEYERAWSFLVAEKSTGHAAFNVVVDKGSGLAAREMGLAMHWDVKYGVSGTVYGPGYGPGYAAGYGPGPGYGCGFRGNGMVPGVGPAVTPGASANGATVQIPEMTVNAANAAKAAAGFLASNQGNTLAVQGSPVAFYGYYEFQTAGGGKSGPAVLVNGYTGQAGFGWLGAPK